MLLIRRTSVPIIQAWCRPATMRLASAIRLQSPPIRSFQSHPFLATTTASSSDSTKASSSSPTSSSSLPTSTTTPSSPPTNTTPTPTNPHLIPADEKEVRMIMYGNGFDRVVIGREGETLLNVAQLNDVDQIEGACEGCMCCSTCHMIFDEKTYKELGPVSDDEQDLIDRAAGATDTSRLGCQVRVTKKLQGARIKIPAEFTNQMV